MTSLAFVIQPDQVCIAVDTLVVGHLDKRPLSFVRKFRVLPSGDVVTGTGLANMINAWFDLASTLPASLDFDALFARAPAILADIAPTIHGHEFSTTSLFHFGWSVSQAKYSGFVCRPPAWAATLLDQNVIRLKPEVPFDSSHENFRLPESFVDILKAQQRLDDQQSVADRQGIGGQIEFVYLHDRDKVDIEVVGEFSSFAGEQECIRNSLASSN